MTSIRFHCLHLLVAAMAAAINAAAAQTPPTMPATAPEKSGSKAFTWESLVARPSRVGATRKIIDAPTVTFERLEAHATTLNPGLASHPPHQHAREELILVKEGTLEVTINGRTERAGAGSVLFYAANDFHSVRNIGDEPSTYLVLNFETTATASAPKQPAAESAQPGSLRSQVFDWEKLEVRPTKTGERRAVFNSPSVTCLNLSCHITTVKAANASHAAHRHPDEEWVVVKEGMIEVTINGATHRGGPGSLFFFASNDDHGMRNAGDTPATYYVIRAVTAATPGRKD